MEDKQSKSETHILDYDQHVVKVKENLKLIYAHDEAKFKKN